MQKLDFQWAAESPFLVTMYHKDAYPVGNEAQGPNASLEGRTIGQDFTIKMVLECITVRQSQDFLIIHIEALKQSQW